ncbi:MAG: hypothetical protein HOP12_05275 [Candidatus Eisenbacteria bacterium]|uniref:FAD-binding PCMH-type domain-containing protein n=1 Tax=Eiseniibacteriota bacterium TaxID=2212470 RepID=A0A849SL48_UNCEI|nr:hypothetical protein [Candidatus Eisenbacteria bacterium]
MKAPLSQLEVVRPRDLDHALQSLAVDDPELRPLPLAGGTDLFVYLNAGTLEARRYLDLSSLRGLRGVRVGRAAVTIGALATFRQLREHREIRRRLPSLAAAAREVGAWQIQERATIAGNIANASPAGDSLPVLLAHDALVQVRSVRGDRTLALDDFYLGYRRLALAADELIVAVIIPWSPPRARAFFRKVGTRRAQSISKVVVATLLRRGRNGAFDHVRIAYGSMAPVPKRARAAEQALLGTRGRAADIAAARTALARDLTPIDDIRSESDYRMEVAGNVLEQCVRVENGGR